MFLFIYLCVTLTKLTSTNKHNTFFSSTWRMGKGPCRVRPVPAVPSFNTPCSSSIWVGQVTVTTHILLLPYFVMPETWDTSETWHLRHIKKNFEEFYWTFTVQRDVLSCLTDIPKWGVLRGRKPCERCEQCLLALSDVCRQTFPFHSELFICAVTHAHTSIHILQTAIYCI